jgi:predicted porin
MHPSRRLSLLAAFAAAGSVGSAQAQLAIYGTMDVGVGQIETQPPGPPNAPLTTGNRGVFSGGMQTSYFGLRGTEDLGGGLKARFQLESFLRVNNGAIGRFDPSPTSAADYFWSREAFVALGNDLGEIRLGNNAIPTWISMIQSSAMGSNSVFSPGFRQLYNGGTRGKSEVDTAMVNSVKYQSPVIAGVEASAAVQSRNGGAGRFSYALNATYRGGPVMVTLATQNVRHAAAPNLSADRDQQLSLLGASWDFGLAKLFAQYTTIDNGRLNIKDKVPHIGLTVPLGNGVIQIASAQDKTSNATTGAQTAKRTTTTAGYVHSLSKRTDLYGFLMNEKLSVGTGESYMAGIRHRF